MQQPPPPAAPTPDYTIPDPPPGVELREPGDFKTLRTRIYDRAKDALEKSFPQVYGGVRMELHGTSYHDPEDYSLSDEKQALAQDQFLGRRLRGTVKLFDHQTGELLDEKNTTLMRVPYLSQRGTFIHGGNDYANLTQSRLIPGIYTRRKKNGTVETQVNVRPGSGNSFRVDLDPESGQFKMHTAGSSLHLYSLLKDMGVPDEQMRDMWGEQVLRMNAAKYDRRTTDKAYLKIVPRFLKEPDPTPERRVELIKNSLERASVHEYVARRNLANMFDMTKQANWKAKELGRQASGVQDLPFLPTMTPEEAMDALMDDCPWMEAGYEAFEKQAADNMEDSLDPDDLQEEYNSLYGRQGPRLASMKKWPDKWIPEGSNELGWLAWYFDYARGKRTSDDERQILRWKSFKSRHGQAFAKNPTPKRAFALRNWAIDPLKLLPDGMKEDFEQEMDAYKEKKKLKWEAEKAGAVPGKKGLEKMACLLNATLGFELGPDTETKAELHERILTHIDNV
jgi:DNA-directed RNA polymerase beta subunit